MFLQSLSGSHFLVNFSPTKKRFSSKVKKCAAKLLAKKGNWCQAGQLVKKHGSYAMSWLVPVQVADSLRVPHPGTWTCFWSFTLPVTPLQPATISCDDVRFACRFRPEDGAIMLEMFSSTARWRRWRSRSEHSDGSGRCSFATRFWHPRLPAHRLLVCYWLDLTFIPEFTGTALHV